MSFGEPHAVHIQAEKGFGACKSAFIVLIWPDTRVGARVGARAGARTGENATGFRRRHVYGVVYIFVFVLWCKLSLCWLCAEGLCVLLIGRFARRPVLAAIILLRRSFHGGGRGDIIVLTKNETEKNEPAFIYIYIHLLIEDAKS